MKKNFEALTETEKALSELPQDVQPFKNTDFAKNALSRRQSAERACSLRRKRRLCAALSLAVCLIVAAAAMVSVLLLKGDAGYNGNGDYESKTVFDFGFQDYNGLYGTDFPVLPPGCRRLPHVSDNNTNKKPKGCPALRNGNRTKPDGSALRSDGRKRTLRRP